MLTPARLAGPPRGVDPEPKRRLTVFLTGLKEADPDLYERLETHHLGGFTTASAADYDAAVDMIRALAEAPPPVQ